MCALLKRAAIGLLLAFSLHVQARSPLFHELDVTLDPANGTLAVEDRIRVIGRDVLTLDLRADLAVRHVSVDGAQFSGDVSVRPLRVDLPDDGQHVVTVRYAGRPSGKRTFVDERGAFLPAGAGWVPGYREAALGYRLRISTPTPYRAVATGEVVELNDNGIAVFSAERALEAPSLFAGEFVVNAHQHGSTRIMTWFPAARAPLSKRYIDNAGRYLDKLEARIGEYPHGAFHIVAGPLPVGLGFPGLTYVSERILRLPFMQTRSLAHEITHSWWGNGVAVDYATGNWSEGLTTYLADYALALDKGPAPAREMRLGWLRDYAALPTELDVPVRRFLSKTHDAAQVIGYNKVAFLFHMLERELTSAKFDAGLRRFWQDHRGKVASWDHLRAAFEVAADRDLGWFFSQWLERPGAPAVALGAVRSEQVEDGFEVHLTLRQSAPLFRVTVPVRVETQTDVKWYPVSLDKSEIKARLRVASRPTRLTVDPGHDVFRQLASGESTPIFRDVTLDPKTRVVIATGNDTDATNSAKHLAGRLLRRQPEFGSPERNGPLVIVGLTAQLEQTLEAAGLEPTAPRSLAGAGTARVWAARRPDGASAMVVAADDAASLSALLRPLPHYRRYGYLVFDGARAKARGIWPATGSALDHKFD